MWNARAPVAGGSDTAHLAAHLKDVHFEDVHFEDVHFEDVLGLERRHRYALRPPRATCLV